MQWTNVAAKTPNLNAIAYMEKLKKAARDSGIVVPLIHNNPNMRTKSWSEDYGAGFGGNVDNYAMDHYPSCCEWIASPFLSCENRPLYR